MLLDVWLPKIDGLETLERIQEMDAAPAVVMISGHGNIETAVRATKLGAFDFVEKPLSLQKVVLVVRNAVEYSRLEAENKRLRAEQDERHQILGNSVPMKALRQQIALTGADERARADLRRERHGQRAGGASASREAARRRDCRSWK